MSDNKETFGGELGKEIGKQLPIREALQTTAKAIDKTLATPFQLINAKTANLRKIAAEEEFTLEKEKILKEKLLEWLRDVPPEKLIEPERYIAMPLLKDLNYAIDNEVIYNRYVSLLATNMNSDTKNMAHPSFIRVVEQLGPLDAQAIDNIGFLEKSQPLIRIFACKEQPEPDVNMDDLGMPEFGNAKNKIPLFSHYSSPIDGLETTARERGFIIQNLNRLGLINVDYREHIIDAEQYKPLYDNLLADPLYHDFFEYTEQNGLHLQLTDGYTSPTDYGRLFFAVCYKKIF